MRACAIVSIAVSLSLYQFLADAVLVLHVGVVLFVVGGLAAVLVGHARGWRWVASPWFRLPHLAAIGVVVAQAWWGVVCPLTTLEMWLRTRARAPTYSGSFIEHWLQALLFWSAPPWVFVAAYTLFGLAVVYAWWRCPPHFGRRAR